jgi:polar amino acid transport system substrate-binding protein
MTRIAAAIAALLTLAACASGPQVSSDVRQELAPSGTLRVGINAGNTAIMRQDIAPGADLRGVPIDLARELGRRLGVPVQLKPYPTAGQAVAAGPAGEWDVAFVAIEPARAKELIFSPPYVLIESTYLVQPGSKLRTIADVDSKGVRIAVAEKGGNDLYLTRTLKAATLVRAKGGDAAFKQFVAEKLDAYAGLRPGLVKLTEQLPGSRVLEGNYTMVQQAIATPVARVKGATYLRQFAEDVKADGTVARAIKNNDLPGLTIAPRAP